jgi:signal transduction histidine kinase
MTGSADMLVMGWPLAALLALAIAGVAGREARRRTALNRALHELRRPLQALTLALPAGSRMERRPAASSLGLAISALADLDRIVNGRKPAESEGACRVGSPVALRSGPVPCRDLVAAAVRRWRARARLAGASIELEWQADGVVVNGDRAAISQAVDNLIVNAIEHGGGRITVGGTARAGRLLISVSDRRPDISDEGAGREQPGGSPGQVIARLLGGSRRGHGLPVVRRTATEHGGRFVLYRGERGATAVLELPLDGDGGLRAA